MRVDSIAELARLLRRRELSSVELTRHCLEAAQQQQHLNCFITLTPELALDQARAADLRLARAEGTVLTGIPIAYKDIYCTTGVKTSCGSRMLDSFIAPYTATAVAQLEAAGMVMIGKTNMDEFAMGSSTEHSWYGPCRNPWDPGRVPGGSSGGSAAAVAAGIVPSALGTDTGGSIRQPAALCGITGLKPTYGLVSRYGMVAFASSLDQGGPMARSALDVAHLLTGLAGFDPKDSTSAQTEPRDYAASLPGNIKGVRIGLPVEYFQEDLDPEIRTLIMAALRELEKAGAILKEVSLPSSHLSIPAYYVIAPAEASSNLSRFDGVRYGYRCSNPRDLQDLYCRSRAEGFGEEVRRRIMIGTYVLSAGYYDAFYLRAQKVRRLIRDEFKSVLRDVDLIAGPTVPGTAFPIGDLSADPVGMYLSDIYTVSVNLAGLPAISIPAGMQGGLPVGMQLIGDYFCEERILQVAHAYQQLTDWHLRTPGGAS